jgi:hypothetical protein
MCKVPKYVQTCHMILLTFVLLVALSRLHNLECFSPIGTYNDQLGTTESVC